MSTKKAEPTGSASKKTRRAYAFFLPGSCASTTAASIRAQPKYSRGYKDQKKKITQKGASVELGTIKMQPDAVMLSDVTITDVYKRQVNGLVRNSVQLLSRPC